MKYLLLAIIILIIPIMGLLIFLAFCEAKDAWYWSKRFMVGQIKIWRNEDGDIVIKIPRNTDFAGASEFVIDKDKFERLLNRILKDEKSI